MSIPAGLRGAGRQSFLPTLSQHARLIAIDTPLAPGALLVERFSGHEAVSGLFRFDVDCLATSAHYELKALVGAQVALHLLQADGSTRRFHGMVHAARQHGGDGGLASYRLTLVPWLHSLTLRRDSYVFQDQSVLDIAEHLFRDYPAASYRFDVRAALPLRSVTMQYRETDYDFLLRLFAEEGLSFFFEHEGEDGGNDAGSERGGEAEASPGRARHRLVVFDHNDALAPGAQASIRFHRAHATEADDTITRFAQRRQVQSNRVALASWDYQTLTAVAAEDAVDDALPAAPCLETWEGAGAYRYTDGAEGARIARARAESLAMAQLAFQGESAVRQLAPGTGFRLTGHPDADGDYLVLAVHHQGANNLASGVSAAPDGAVERGSYRNHFTCVPRSTPVRPAYWFPKPNAPGAQVALVVGVAGEEITTERDHRVKVQFPWQRGERPAAGQLAHPATPNASGDERAGTWVRVAEAAAGANWGAAFIPRIGQEVSVGFVAGDIDRPVITGQLYNGADTPPFHGADNHPGALSGIQSKEYAGSGFNQWVIDDTPGQLRQRLASTYTASQLNLGYLVRQDGNRRGAYRGAGFEAATDAWSMLRARRGLFLSTSQRAGAVSTQLDTQEAQGKLKSAGELAHALSEAAVQHRAQALSTPDGVQQWLQTVGGKERFDNEEAPAFAQAVALVDSAAAVGLATPASAVLFAGQDLNVTAALALRMTAGQAASVAVAKSASLFTHAGGAKVIAAKEAVSLRAHTGPLDAVAQQAVTVTSSNGQIKVQAKREVLLAAGGGYIRLAGGNIDIHCPASISVKGVAHAFMGAGSRAAALPVLPDTRMHPFDEHFQLEDETSGEKQADIPYRVLRPSTGEEIRAVTDGTGKTLLAGTEESADGLHVFYAGDDEVKHDWN